MFCPECGTEYAPGVTRCEECGVDLVAEPPPAAVDTAEWKDLVTVLVTDDPALVPVARSMLEAEGIPCFARGDGLQDLVGLGRVGGSNLVFGPVELQVPRGREAEARALLATEVPPEGAPTEE
jgi:hypothetical protein